MALNVSHCSFVLSNVPHSSSFSHLLSHGHTWYVPLSPIFAVRPEGLIRYRCNFFPNATFWNYYFSVSPVLIWNERQIIKQIYTDSFKIIIRCCSCNTKENKMKATYTINYAHCCVGAPACLTRRQADVLSETMVTVAGTNTYQCRGGHQRHRSSGIDVGDIIFQNAEHPLQVPNKTKFGVSQSLNSWSQNN